MKSILLLLLLSLGLTGCQKDSDTGCPASLTGTWTLVSRVCFCAPRVSSPQESVRFNDKGEFTFYKDGQVVSSGTYTFYTISGNSSCNANQRAVLFTYAPGAPYSANGASYSIADCRLTLDYGGCLDAPVDTYARQ